MLEQTDARRYVWCTSLAMWRFVYSLRGAYLDLAGAIEENDDGLAVGALHDFSYQLASILLLLDHLMRPLPPRELRVGVALKVGRTSLSPLLEAVTSDSLSVDRRIEAAEEAMTILGARFGELPAITDPNGLYPAMALVRDWIKILDRLGEDDFLPSGWKSSDR